MIFLFFCIPQILGNMNLVEAFVIKHWHAVRYLFLFLLSVFFFTVVILLSKFKKALYIFVFVIAGHYTISLCSRRIQGFLYSWVQETQLSVSSFHFSLPLLLSILRLVRALSKSVVPFLRLGQLVWAYSSENEAILYCGTGLTTNAWRGWYFPGVGTWAHGTQPSAWGVPGSWLGSWDRDLTGAWLLPNRLFSLLLSPEETLGKGVGRGGL